MIKEYEAEVEQIVSGYSFELFVYDEIENFKEYDDPDFNYPYDRRKTKISQNTLQFIFGDE